MNKKLGPEKGLIFRIVHRVNMPWIFEHGLHCPNSPTRHPGYQAIGNPELISKRNNRIVPIPPGGTLSDYVPFYFTPYLPMLLNIKTGYGGITRQPNRNIVFVVTSLPRLRDLGIPFVFSDRHAYVIGAQFFNDLAYLDRIDWAILRARDFKREADDPGKMERYQAEALVYGRLPANFLLGVVCYNAGEQSALKAMAESRGVEIPIYERGGWYS